MHHFSDIRLQKCCDLENQVESVTTMTGRRTQLGNNNTTIDTVHTTSY